MTNLPSSRKSPSLFHQDSKLRTIFYVVVGLIVWSNLEIWAMRALNAAIHRPESSIGPSLLMLLRVLVTMWLVRMICQLPQSDARSRPASIGGPTKNGNFDPLLGMRAMACLMVMLGHFFMVTFATAFYSRSLYLVMSLFRSAPWQGVWIFFTLSGYLMGKGFIRGRYSQDAVGIRSFYRNRMLRILPVYLVATVILGVFRQPEVFLPHRWWTIAQVLVFDYRESPFTVVGALWSVSTEVQFYLLVPFLFVFATWAYRKSNRGFVTGLWLLYPFFVLLRTIALHFFRADYESQIYTSCIFNLDLFFVGMSLNLLPKMSVRRIKPSVLLLPLAATTYLVCCFMANGFDLVHMDLLRFWTFAPMLTAPFAVLFIRVSEVSEPISFGTGLRRVVLRALAATGTMAYSLYVFHSQIYESVRTLLPSPRLSHLTAFAFAPLCLGLAFLVGWFFYSFVEEPFELRKRVLDEPITDAP